MTGGRLEVTALGDEVNECARVEQSARGGAVLGSRALLERLDEEDARAIGLDLDTLSYQTVSELSDAGPKAIRDAGTLAVTDLRRSNIGATRGSSSG